MFKSCRQASELMSLQMDEPLRWRLRAALQLHLLICAGCRRAEKQMNFLRVAAKRCGNHEAKL